MLDKKINNFPPLQFALFRTAFGTYLVIHFIHLIPSSPDIWSLQGMMGNTSLNFTYGKFPNLLNIFDSPTQIRIFLFLMAVLSCMLLLGFYRRTASVILWYGRACLFHRNNLISTPGLPMIGWLLLAMALVPIGEPFTLQKKTDKEWFMPSPLFWGAWWITAVAYTISGFDKLMAPSWRDGTAILHLIHNLLARDWFVRDFLLLCASPHHLSPNMAGSCFRNGFWYYVHIQEDKALGLVYDHGDAYRHIDCC